MKATVKYSWTFAHLLLTLLITSCTNQPPVKSTNNTFSGEVLADTIIYSVVIKNRDPLDTWTEKCLSKLDRKTMVDQIFLSVYKHDATPYNYSNNQALSISDIKDLEKQEDFSRDKVGKLQFWETWYYDEQKKQLTKKVISILVAYEIVNDADELRGYKAAFYIKMNND